MSWPEPRNDRAVPFGSPHSDLVQALQKSVHEGLTPDLALDLVLHELAIRAADATGASAAAIALSRNGEMVCRASAGYHAPDLGIRLNTRDGLSGACLSSREPQLCLDTESDPRVDPDACRRLGIRSMLIVPILEADSPRGIVEVFSPDPEAFSPAHDMLLESFARTCARLSRLADELERRPGPVEVPASDHAGPLFASVLPMPKSRPGGDFWTAILGSLVIASAFALLFLIGSRTGWLRGTQPQKPPASTASSAQSIAAQPPLPQDPSRTPGTTATSKHAVSANPDPSSLVVYDQGKLIFKMKPTARGAKYATRAAITADDGEAAIVWLAPAAAERRLQHRVEPQYPADAITARRAGDVTVEIVVGSDGSVVSLRIVKGDPLLADAAASAVRKWRYDPLRIQGRPSHFLTDVTLKFSLPN